MSPAAPLPDFELMATDGQPFRLSDNDGDLTLIVFGYTFCPDVCPITLAQIKQVLADLDEQDRARVHVVFISVDPDRDTPEVLERYVTAFGPEFMGLTDEYEKIEAVMKPFGAFAQKEEASASAARYLVSHTARLYLVGPKRELLLQYAFDPEGSTIEDLHSDLIYLLNQEGI